MANGCGTDDASLQSREWRWEDATYEVLLRIRPLDDDSSATVVARATYLAVPVSTIPELMEEIGLSSVARLDDVYYQPLLVGTVSRADDSR